MLMMTKMAGSSSTSPSSTGDNHLGIIRTKLSMISEINGTTGEGEMRDRMSNPRARKSFVPGWICRNALCCAM